MPVCCIQIFISGWRHQMETFSALLAICAVNSPVTGEFPTQRPVTRTFDAFFDLRLNRRLRKQWWGWWLWRHCDVIAALSRSRSFLPSCCRGLSASFWRWPELFQMTPRRPLSTPERIPNYTSSGMRNGLTSHILVRIFTHWDRYKMASNFLTIFSNVFS